MKTKEQVFASGNIEDSNLSKLSNSITAEALSLSRLLRIITSRSFWPECQGYFEGLATVEELKSLKAVKSLIHADFKSVKEIDGKTEERICMIFRKENGERVQVYNKEGLPVMKEGKPLMAFVGNGTYSYKLANINTWSLKRLISLLKQSAELKGDELQKDEPKDEASK